MNRALDAPIRAGRLVLRPLEDRDAVAIARIRGDAEAARMGGDVPHPYPVEAARGWIALMAAKRAFGREFAFAIEDPQIGVVGDVAVFKRRPSEDWELGYAVARPYRRRGYAREALLASLPWARRALGARTVKAGVFEDNAASFALLDSCGFTLNGAAIDVYSLARDAKVRCLYLARDLTTP